jgi:glucan phosphoethanolaminetransferase (alkaline phosphatase superfamily)
MDTKTVTDYIPDSQAAQQAVQDFTNKLIQAAPENLNVTYVFYLLLIFMAIWVLNYSLVKYFTDPIESMRLTTLIQVLSFSSVISYISLIPFDVYTAVNHTNQTPIFGLISIYDLYFGLNYLMIGLVLLMLPWSFFYAEEALDFSDDMDMEFDSEAGTFDSMNISSGGRGPKGYEDQGCCERF